MANLFPEDTQWSIADRAEDGGEILESDLARMVPSRSWLFDFSVGEFVMTPTRKVVVTKDSAAWLMWCQKAVRTPRYRHLIYSRHHGQEYEDLIGQSYSKAVLESEIERMTIETLMQDRRTAAVNNFTFTWTTESCSFTCRLRNIWDESEVLEGSVSV